MDGLIAMLEHEAPGAIVELVPRAARTFPPAVAPARVAVAARRESDPAVMLGFVALVVACWLVAALLVLGLWVVT